MKIWKKILISSLAVIAAGVLVVGIISLSSYISRQREYARYLEEYNQTHPTWLSENIQMVQLDNGVRLKDVRTGKFTTPKLKHVFINKYSDDSLVVFRDFHKKRGFLNTRTGKIILPAKYDRAWNFREGVAAVYLDGTISFINSQGKQAFPTTFPIQYNDDAFLFHDGYCAMSNLEGRWGLINHDGEWLIDPVFSEIDAPYHGYRRVYDGDHYGLLTTNGDVALPLIYDDIKRADSGDGFLLYKEGLCRQVDFNLTITIPFVHNGIHLLSYVDSYRENDYYDNNGNHYFVVPRFFRFDVGYGSGVVDLNGNVIIPAKYYMIRLVNEELFEVEVTCDGERILMDAHGRYVGSSSN